MDKGIEKTFEAGEGGNDVQKEEQKRCTGRKRKEGER